MLTKRYHFNLVAEQSFSHFKNNFFNQNKEEVYQTVNFNQMTQGWDYINEDNADYFVQIYIYAEF